MKALADDVWTCITEKHQLDLGYRVARIYRDARRVRDGNLYKEHLWFSLEKEHENWQSTPVFFFEIEPEGYMYGLGYYNASAETMKKFRARLDANPAEFERIAAPIKAAGIFEIDGDEYSRKKAERDGIIGDYYNRKTVSLLAPQKGHEAIYSADFADTLCRDFETLLPLYNFFWSLEGDSPVDESSK
jgi:uncharacterized protein (DUF2461 family)